MYGQRQSTFENWAFSPRYNYQKIQKIYTLTYKKENRNEIHNFVYMNTTDQARCYKWVRKLMGSFRGDLHFLYRILVGHVTFYIKKSWAINKEEICSKNKLFKNSKIHLIIGTYHLNKSNRLHEEQFTTKTGKLQGFLWDSENLKVNCSRLQVKTKKEKIIFLLKNVSMWEFEENLQDCKRMYALLKITFFFLVYIKEGCLCFKTLRDSI